ncbi:MAG: tetratricopeptide repeat protein [Verrucomicrobiales bacterium]|nr:tetratricopeptide repeat protein [Verrucomicrobiales bacterium]
MRADLWELYAELERAPEDWSVRLRLIEAAVAAGDLAEAKRLVRTSPESDAHLPAELQDRIHALLTGAPRGKSPAVVEVEPEGGEA